MSDREWLVPCTFVVGIELLLWFAAWRAGVAYAPLLIPYSLIAVAFFTFVVGVRLMLILVTAARAGEQRPLALVGRLIVQNRNRIIAAVLGLELLSLGSSAFSALKGGIPRTNPFWLDIPLARVEGPIWPTLNSLLGWAIPFFDRLYGTFVLSHLLAVFGVLAMKPSELKSRALVSLCLAWVVLGILGAYALSSAGPLFYDRVFDSHRFAALDAVVAVHAPLTGMTADALWHSYSANLSTVANGISAMPSMHVGLTLWLALVLMRTRAAPIAWTYYALIWTGSVLLGWHYFSDGLIGSLGLLAMWKAAPLLLWKPPFAFWRKAQLPIRFQ